jgi:isocitrate lyase
MKLACRVFGHDGAPWWVPVSRTAAGCTVEVRRCFRCGDIVEQRDTISFELRVSQEQAKGLYENIVRRQGDRAEDWR